jgi:outer membrane protein assembly factor BamB
MATGDYVISADGRTLYVIMYEPYPRSMGSLYALNTLDGSVRWKFKVASGQGLRWRPAIGPEGTIYCAGNGGLFAIKPDGSAKWEFNTGGSSYYSSSPSVDNAGNIYQQSTFYIHSITPLGEERWRHANMLWDTELSTPTIAYDGTIHAIGICAANSECLLAFDYLGQLKWSVPFSQIKTGLYDTQNSPVIDVEGTVYLGLLTARTSTDTVNFIAIKADGSLKFKMPLRSPDGSLPDIDSTPCIASDGTLYIGSDRPRGKHLYAIK